MSDAVWAKLRYCSYWPGKIVDPVPPGLKKPARKFCVFFFGTNNYGFVNVENTCSYSTFRTKYMSKGRGHAFAEAVSQCDSYILDPREHAIGPNLIVATEYDYIVKQEPKDDEPFYHTEVIATPDCDATGHLAPKDDEQPIPIRTNCTGCSAKQTCIDQLQTESKKLSDCVLSTKKELENIRAEKRKNEEAFSEQLKKIRIIHEAEMRKIKDHSEQMLQPKKDDGFEAIQESSHQPHQRQADRPTTRSRSSTTDVFDVECLLGHKEHKGELQFLVRWKGFSKEHDEWVKRENLLCPGVLKDYLKSTKLKWALIPK